MVFFFDLDIFSTRPRVTPAPEERSISTPSCTTSISSGDSQRLSRLLYVSWVTMPCVNRPLNGSLIDSRPMRSSARVQKRA